MARRRILAGRWWRVACAAVVMAACGLARAQGMELGCYMVLGDYEYGWSAEVAPAPVDVAYASNGQAYFDELREQNNWQAFPREGLEVLGSSGVRSYALPNGGSRTVKVEIQPRPRGYWSLQHSARDRWLYDISLYMEVITVTECSASGSCKTQTMEHNWAVCATGGDVPYRLELAVPTTRITAGLGPIRLNMRLMHGELPVRQRVQIEETLASHRPFGSLACTPNACPWHLYVDPDDEGYFDLEFRPKAFKPASIPLSFTCAGCGNSADVTLEMRPEIVIGFFNGVGNTSEAAQESLNRLQREFGSRYEDSPLKYDWFYNQTACGEGTTGKPSCLEDLAEVFEQRSLELGGVFANRWETFWDIVASRHQQATSLTGRLIDLLGSGSNALLQWLDTSVNAILNQLVRDTLKLLTLFKDSPTYDNRADHMERLWRHADNDDSMVLVAHSQGNLFVNSAFDALKSFKPDARARVVHVAPASPTLRGDYVLADIDLVINALRGTGLNSVPDVNIRLPFSSGDRSGHGFDPTYLDKARAAHSRTMGLITNSLEALAQ